MGPTLRFVRAYCSVAAFLKTSLADSFSPKGVEEEWRCCRTDVRQAHTAAQAGTPPCTDQFCERRWACLRGRAGRAAVSPPFRPCKPETKRLRHQHRKDVHPKNEFRDVR